MDRLDKIGKGNSPPPPQNTKLIVADDYNKIVDKVNEIITTSEDIQEIQLNTSPIETAQLRFRSEVNAIMTAKAGLTLVVEKIV